MMVLPLRKEIGLDVREFDTFVVGPGTGVNEAQLNLTESVQLLDREDPVRELISQIAWDNEHGDGEVIAAGVLVEGTWNVIIREIDESGVSIFHVNTGGVIVPELV